MLWKVCIGILVALAVLVVAYVLWEQYGGRPTEFSFARITEGMTLERVEGILGPGKEIPRERVPQWAGKAKHRDGSVSDKVIEGDRFFFWETGDGVGFGFYISFKENKVVEKHEFDPSM
jgi:hypothetical protein